MLKSRMRLLQHCLYPLIPQVLQGLPVQDPLATPAVLLVTTFTIHVLVLVLDLRVEKHYSGFGVCLLIGPLHSRA
jgi:uncharacterized membrane protein